MTPSWRSELAASPASRAASAGVVKSAGAVAGGRSGNELSSPPFWSAITHGGTRFALRATTTASPAIWPSCTGSP